MSNTESPLQPPVPFADFEFTFDPSLSSIFPNPPPLPSSADLFSPAETTDLLGFLDNFGDLGWDLDPYHYDHLPPSTAPYSNPHLNTAPDQSTSSQRNKSTSRATRGHNPDPAFTAHRGASQPRSTTSESSAATTPTPTYSTAPDASLRGTPTTISAAGAGATRTKPLLSTPQKRLNHIMSEQKRRNAIRDGYAQLIALMAPAGSAPGIGMPTRGRPKGSGSRGKGQSKGKSGVLFRAVEYCRWLQEGRDALADEVRRVEAAAGIRHS